MLLMLIKGYKESLVGGLSVLGVFGHCEYICVCGFVCNKRSSATRDILSSGRVSRTNAQELIQF